MIYEGIVIKEDKLFLFIFDPDKQIIRDGINISEHTCYNDLKEDQFMVVDVIFKDGTKEIDKIDLDEFIYGDKYESARDNYDIFIYIHDNMLFSMNNGVKLEEVINRGGLNKLAIDAIAISKKDKEKDE